MTTGFGTGNFGNGRGNFSISESR